MTAAVPPPTTPPAAPTRRRVAVVVPYYEGQQQLDRLLAGLDEQTLAATDFEVVVADDGSREPPAVGERAYPVQVVRQPDEGFRAAAARNLGAQASSAPVLAFLDQDCVPGPDYLAQVVAAVTSPWDLVVGHRKHVDLDGWDAPRVREWLSGGPAPTELEEPAWLLEGYARTHQLTRPDPRSYQLVISAVLSLHRELWEAVGGFDPSFRAYGGEDWELAHRCLVAGADTRWLPDAVAWHDGPDLVGRDAAWVTAKNAETLALARLVPDRDVRGEHLVWAMPDIVVRLRVGDAPTATVIACVESLLSGSDAHVWLDRDREESGVLACLEDPRVHVGEPGRDVTARARYVVDADPVLLGGTTLRALSLLCADAPVQGPGLRVALARDEHRRARGIPSAPPQPLPPEATVTRLTEEPALERLWQSR